MMTREVGQDHFAAVGRVVAAWNRIEFSLGLIIRSVDLSTFSQVVFEATSNDARFRIARWVLENYGTSDEIQYFDKFIKHANVCKLNRNKIVHATYEANDEPEGGKLTLFSRVRDFSFSFAKLSANQLFEIAQDTDMVAGQGFNLGVATMSRRASLVPAYPDVTPFELPSLDTLLAPRTWDQILASQI